jgi:hypothetical protein
MREEHRLEPVRWRRPGWATLLRPALVAALLGTAALLLWSRPPACAGQRTAGTPAAAEQRRTAPADPAQQRRAAPGKPAEPAPAAAPGCSAEPRGGDRRRGAGAAGHPRVTGITVPPAPGRPRVPVGTVGVPIRLAEPAALELVHVGDRVDLFRTGDTGARAPALAIGALVLDVTDTADPASAGLLLALTPAQATHALTGAGAGYAVVIRPDG